MNKIMQKVQNAELDGFAVSVLKAFESDKNAKKDAFVAKKMAELQTAHDALNTAILKDKEKSTLSELDSVRDEKFLVAKKMCEVYALFPIAKKKELNEPIKAIFDKYAKANLMSVNYKSESSLIESMKKDLEPFSENIALLDGMKEALDALFEAEENFSRANQDYVNALSAKSESASSLKKPLLSIINDNLVVYLSAMIVSENENCFDFAKFFEAEIERTNAVIEKRSALPKSKNEA